MYKYLLLVWLLSGCTFAAFAQKPDTTAILNVKKKDTLTATKHDSVVAREFAPHKKEKIYHPDTTHSPRVAVMHSLILPGWGQVYNHQIWKVPLVVIAVGTPIYLVFFNSGLYSEFLTLAKYREHGITPLPTDKYYTEYNQFSAISSQAIYDAANFYQRDRDLSYLAIIGFWGINVVDAYINAKFIHSYSVDNNLAMKVSPTFISQPIYASNPISSYIPGIKITFTLK
jgi:hypothetical protein